MFESHLQAKIHPSCRVSTFLVMCLFLLSWTCKFSISGEKKQNRHYWAHGIVSATFIQFLASKNVWAVLWLLVPFLFPWTLSILLRSSSWASREDEAK